MSEASNTASVPLDASTREALERVRLYLPLDSRHPAHAALALIESTLERLERERDAALEAERLIHERSEEAEVAWGAAEARAERYAEALVVADQLIQWLGNNHPKVVREIPTGLYGRIREVAAALTPETEQPDNRSFSEIVDSGTITRRDFWRPDGRCPEC